LGDLKNSRFRHKGVLYGMPPATRLQGIRAADLSRLRNRKLTPLRERGRLNSAGQRFVYLASQLSISSQKLQIKIHRSDGGRSSHQVGSAVAHDGPLPRKSPGVNERVLEPDDCGSQNASV
jgi:hypothetical protein